MDFGTGRTYRRLFLFGTLLGVFFALCLLKPSPARAATGINQQINFQGRLLDSTGATAPDGFYNIQFKIYQDGDGQSVGNSTGSPAGTLKWTESYLNNNTQGVKVQNGFMSVQLGSITAFGSSIDWNQSTLWLSMNIGNTNPTCTPFTSCSPDGEMVPMQAMTSAVYALNAMQLGGLTASSFGQLSQNQTWTGYNTYRPAVDSTAAFKLQNQSAGTAYVTGDSTNNQLILGTASSLTGKLAFATVGGGTLTVIPTSSASSFTITLPAETGTVCTTAATGVCSTAGSGYVQLAPLAVQADNTTNNSIFINKTNATGNILELQKSGSDVFKVANNGDITLTGTLNGDTVSSTAFTFSGANPVISASTSNTGLTTQANGTGTLTLNTTGAGTVNLGATNTSTINIGSSASTNTVLGTTNINTSGTAATVIGNTGSTVAIASSALNLTAAGAITGVTTLGLSGAISGATATNTINGIVINSQAVSNVTTLGLSGAITGATATNTINGLVINGGALTSVTGITSNGGYTQSGSTANTLTGATTLSGNLIVTGAASVAIQKGTDFSTTGTSTAASFTGSLIRLTGSSLQTIQGITGATDGRIITLVNAAGQAAVIANQNAGATATERIVTGTGADLSLAPDTSIELRYDTTTSRWRVIGSVGGTSVTTVGAVNGTPTANGATITGNTLNLAVADGSNAGLISTAAQTLGGVKTFSSNIVAPTSTNTINGLIISAGALSGIAGYTQSTGAFAFSGGGNYSVDSAAFDVTSAGAVSGVTTLGLSGAITGATATNTINGLIINSGALSGITGYTQSSGALAFSGAGNFSVDSAAFDVTTAGAVSGVTTLGLSGAITGATATNTINGLVINSGALTSVTGITSNGGYTQSGSTANTLTGATTISGNLIVTGAASLAVQKGTDFSTAGTSTAASFTGSLIRLTGASAQTIQGITGATDGRIITLVNVAGQAAIIANQNAGATASERIVTGTGSDVSLAPDTSIQLSYDITTSRWRLVGGIGGTGVSNVGSVSGTPTANGATITGNTLNLAVADGSNAGLISTAAQTLGGVKTFSSNIIAPTSTNTINGLIINAGALSGIAGYTQSTGAFAFSGGGNYSVDSAAFDVTAAGAVSGVTTLGLSGAITGATSTNTINGLIINSGTLSGITGYTQASGALAFSGAGNFSVDSAAFDVTAAGAISGVTTINLSGAITGATATNTINGVVINSGALTSVTGITTNGGYTQSGATANTLTGATTLSGNLIVTGAASVAIQKGTDFSTTGTSTAASFTGSLIRLNGGTTQTIQGITGATDGRIITLVNAAGQAAVIANQNAGATAAERIITGTGADISLAPDTSIELRYDTSTSRWRVIGSVGGTSVTTVGAVSSTPTANGASISGNTLNLAVADGSNAGLVSTIAQTFNGVKTFSNNIIAPTSTNTINGLIINAGALSGIAGYTQSTGAFAFSGGGNFSVDSAAFDVTTAGAVSGVTTLGLSGAITGATATNTINGLIINSGALSGITGYTQSSGALAFSGAGNFSVDSAAFDVNTSGAISGVTTLGLSGAITGATATNTINGLVINSGALTSVTGITTNGGYVQSGATANTLTGATTLSGNLIVTGAASVAVQKGTDFSTTGTSTAASFTGSLIRLTGSSLQTIQGITGATDGRIITLVNTAGQAAIIANQNAGATAAERIVTGTGADITVAPDTSIELRYDTTTSRWRVVSGSASGANASLSNLSGVAINTSLLPATTNSINVGSNSLTFASGFFGGNVQTPLVNTFDQTAASTASSALTLRSGNASGSGGTSGTGAVTIKSGDSTNGASGAISIDSGTASGGQNGVITIGSTNSTSLALGNTGANTVTSLLGGSGATAIQLNQGLGGTITIGTTGSGSTVNIQCGSSTTCGFANNATDHSTTIGSTTTASATTIQSGTSGITLTGNITAAGTYNTNTFSSTALTFAGASPVISASTTNTGLTVRANGTGTLTLNTTGAGTVNLGTANTTTIGIGNASSANTVLGTTGITGITTINNTGTAATTIGQGTGTAGTILIQGGVSSSFSVTNSSGSSVLAFAAPSTAGIVTYQLPAGGTGGNTYSICTTLVVCSGYSAPGANTALSNLSSVAINTSLLPASNNAIDIGSATLAFANGYFGTSVQSPLFNTADQTANSTSSTALSVRSGDVTGTNSDSGATTFRSGNATRNTGSLTIKSGNSTTSGSSGDISIDVGTVTSGTKGSITLGSTSANNVTVGNTSGTTTLIQGGSTLSLQTATSGSLNIGTTNSSSIFIGSTGNTNSITLGQSTAGETINIENGATAATTAVNILSGVGTAGIATLSLGNNTRVTAIGLGNINPAAARTISLGNTTGTANAFVDTINIATNATTVAGGNTVHIADGTPTGSGTNLVTIGSLANASTTIIQGGNSGSGIQITQGTGGNVTIGSANTASTVTIQCGAGTSSSCGFGVNGNDHSTYIGSTTGVSNTVVQSGSGGINLNGAVTTSGTINTNTLTATALTFSGANPVISASTTNTGMTLQSNGTGILTLNSSGAGTVNVGTTNTTTIGIGNTTAATQTLVQGGTGSSALGIQVGTNGTLAVGTAAAATINIGNTTATTVTTINGGTNGTSALALQVGNGGAINIGTTVQTSIQNIGNTSASSLTLINGGTSSTAIQVLQGTGGVITLGGTGSGSTVTLQCGAGTTTCNLGSNATDHTTILGSTTTASATTIQAGTSGISLAGSTTVSANSNLTLASGTGQFLQTFTGTTTDANTIIANSLTTGKAFKINSTNNTAANTSWSGTQFNATNAQSTTAASGFIYGADFEFTQNPTVAGNNESAVNIAIAANASSPADNSVSSILNIANNDTGTGNQIVATAGIKINGANVTNGIDLSGTFGTNLITSTGFNLSNNGSATLGASAGSGALLINNGATLNTAKAVLDDSDGGSLGGTPGTPLTAAQSVDVYTYFTIAQTTASQTITIPSPTSATAGRIIYITNTGSTSFNLLSASISAGTSATLVWSGTAWTFAGADGSSILNQNSTTQTANFLINGSGQANTSFLTPLLDTPTGTTTLNIGTTNASSGINLNQNTTIAAGKSLTVGASAGSGSVFINNGATINIAKAVSNDSDGGSLGGTPGTPLTAAQSVDIYSYFTVNQTTASQTITIPSPTSTTAGRIIYITNIGSVPFTLLSATITNGTSATLVWSGSAWTFAGADGSSILNQNSTTQTANFLISGTGQANTSFTSPLVDSITGGLNLGTVTATGVTIGSTTNTTSIVLQGAAAATYTIGNTTTTGTITVGQYSGSSSNTINVGNNIGASGTQTVNIGSSSTASSTTNVTIGSTVGASTLTLQAGTSNLKLSPNGASNTGVLLKPTNDSTKLLVIQTSGGSDLLTVDSTNKIIRIGSSTSNNNTIIFALNNNDGTTTPTEVDGGMYFNGATSQFMCGENGFWVSCGVPPRDHSYDQYDEFMNGMGNDGIPTSVCTSPCQILPTNTVGIGALNWYNSLIGTPPTTLKYLYNQTGGNAPTADANRPGILDIQQTGTGNNTGQTMSLGVASMKLGTSLIDLKTAVNITGSNLTTLIGLHNETTATTAPTTGAYFKEAGNGTWNVCYVNATPAETCSAATGSPSATAGTWYRLEIIIVSSTQIDFYINGTKTSLTGITYNTTNRVAPAFTSYKTSGSPGTLDVYIDYFQLLGTTTTGR